MSIIELSSDIDLIDKILPSRHLSKIVSKESAISVFRGVDKILSPPRPNEIVSKDNTICIPISRPYTPIITLNR